MKRKIYQLFLLPLIALSCSKIATQDFNEDYSTMNLSTFESSNCYIVSEAGKYKFKTVKGNSKESVGSVSSCEVLWESFGTSTAPSIGDLIKSVAYKDGYIGFETASTFREGNAVIAAKDVNGTILWSWHIWLTDQPQGQTYNNGAGVMMDRNLGATSATPGEVGALGLLYQWGRKDPFLGSSSISDDIEAKSTITWPSSVSSSSSQGTIAYATTHPTHSSQEIATITIGIIHQTGQQTTPVGSPARQSMTLVLLVGEFRMAEAVVFGQRPSVQAVVGKPHPIGIQRTEEWISPKQTRS